jgi:hypothetical protein
MSSGPRLILFGLSGLLLASLAWRAVDLAARPPFEPKIVKRIRPAVRLEDATLRWTTTGGEIELWGEIIRPGHTRLVALHLGPSTHLDVSGSGSGAAVRLTVRRPGHPPIRVIGAT